MTPSLPQLLIVLVIVVLLFGTKKLRSLGSDLGSAIKSFRSAVKDGEEKNKENAQLDKKEEHAETQQQQQSEKDKNKA